MKTYDEVMSAKLFSYTRVAPDYPLQEDLFDLEDLVAYAAKVSNPSSLKQADLHNSDRLIKYLLDHSHWSPLEMVDVTLEFVTTRDISHQVIRHKSFSFQEFSQRYAEVLTDDDQAIQFVYSEARRQDPKNRQNSIPLDVSKEEDYWLDWWWKETQEEIARIVGHRYKDAIERGLAKEVARKILPEGLTTTRAFMKGSMRSWVHYIDLRSKNGTQKEHMQLAKLMADAIQQVFPMIEDYK